MRSDLTCEGANFLLSITELSDLTRDIEGLEDYRKEVFEELTEKLEEKEKSVNDILSQD